MSSFMDHIRKSMDPNFVAPEEIKEEVAKPKIKVATPMTLDERLKASIAEAVDPKTKKKVAPAAPDLQPPVQKPDPNAGKPPPLETVADPDQCKKEKAFGKGIEQDKVALGGKTPVDLNPSTEPPSPKDLEDPTLKKGNKKMAKVDETFGAALKLAGKGALSVAGRAAASGAGLPPKKTARAVSRFVSTWKRPGAGAAAPAAATVGSAGTARSQTSTRAGQSSRRQRASGATANAARYRAGRTGGAATAATTGTAAKTNAARYRSGGAATVGKATAATPAKRGRSSLSGGSTSASSSTKYADKMRSVIASSKASKSKSSAPKRASSVLGKSSKATVAKAPAAKDMGKSTTPAKRERSSLSGAHQSSNEPTRMDRKDFAKQMKASGNNLKKIRTSLSDEYADFNQLVSLLEWKGNRFDQPAPMSHHTADEHFEKMIDHHDHGLDAKERGDKSAARVHFRTRDKHFAHFVHKATDHELHKRKLNMHKVRAMLDVKEEFGPLNKIMSIYRKLRVT